MASTAKRDGPVFPYYAYSFSEVFSLLLDPWTRRMRRYIEKSKGASRSLSRISNTDRPQQANGPVSDRFPLPPVSDGFPPLLSRQISLSAQTHTDTTITKPAATRTGTIPNDRMSSPQVTIATVDSDALSAAVAQMNLWGEEGKEAPIRQLMTHAQYVLQNMAQTEEVRLLERKVDAEGYVVRSAEWNCGSPTHVRSLELRYMARVSFHDKRDLSDARICGRGRAQPAWVQRLRCEYRPTEGTDCMETEDIERSEIDYGDWDDAACVDVPIAVRVYFRPYDFRKQMQVGSTFEALYGQDEEDEVGASAGSVCRFRLESYTRVDPDTALVSTDSLRIVKLEADQSTDATLQWDVDDYELNYVYVLPDSIEPPVASEQASEDPIVQQDAKRMKTE